MRKTVRLHYKAYVKVVNINSKTNHFAFIVNKYTLTTLMMESNG